MKRKILTIITIGSIFIMTLTGCVNFTYRNPVKSETAAYEADLPDTSQIEITEDTEQEIKEEIKEEAKEEIKEEAKEETKEEIKEETKEEIKEEVKEEIKEEVKKEIKEKAEKETEKDTESPVVRDAGIYQSDGSFIPWDDLGMDVETDYTWNNFFTEAKSPCKIYTDNKYNGEIVFSQNIIHIGMHAFAYCDSLTSADLSNTQIAGIGEKAYYCCTSLESVALPDTIASIENDAFYGCTSLAGVDFPDALSIIGRSAFGKCTSFTRVDLSDTQIASLGEFAFYSCTSLESIDLPKTLTYIGHGAFDGCTSLKNISFNGTKAEWDSIIKDDSWNEESILKIITFADVVSIPDDAVKFNGHYYYLYEGGIASTYEEAAKYCNGKGGYLATITSQEENDFVYSYILQQGFESAYFGLSDSASEGTWEWCTGEPLDYTNWHSGEPNNEYSNEDYGLFYYKYSDGSWNDGDFNRKTVNDGSAFICEWGEFLPE